MSRLLQGPVTLFSTSDARKKENFDARVRRSSTCKDRPYECIYEPNTPAGGKIGDVMAVRFFGFLSHPRNPSPNSWQCVKGKNHICILRTNNMVKLKTTTYYHYHSIKTQKINNVIITTYSSHQYLYIGAFILLISIMCIDIFLYSYTAIFSCFLSIFICF